MKNIQTAGLIRQLDRKSDIKPVIYEGQSFRSVYSRTKQHISDYKSQDNMSWMYYHTQMVHGGSIGQDILSDYKFVCLDRFRGNLDRQCDEGYRQMVFEKYQKAGKAVLCNSKLDFIQPFKTSIAVHRGSLNRAPGQAESDRQTNQEKMTRESQTDRAEGIRQTGKKTDKGQKRMLGAEPGDHPAARDYTAKVSQAKRPRQFN